MKVMSFFILAIIVMTLSIILLGFLELHPLAKKSPANRIRRIGHFVSSILFAASTFVWFSAGTIIVGILFTIAVIMARLVPVLNHAWRVHRKSYGILLFPLGMLLPLLFITSDYQPEYLAGVLILGFADPAANYIGTKYGSLKYKILKTTKSLQGSLAFFIVTLFVLTLYSILVAPLSIVFIATIAILLTIAEALLVVGLDNLFIPLFTTLLLVFFK